MSEPVFLTALLIAGTTLVLVAGAIGGALRGRGSSRSELTQLTELHERLDFAERLLAQSRDRAALKSEN
jgi:hypothetical protein